MWGEFARSNGVLCALPSGMDPEIRALAPKTGEASPTDAVCLTGVGRAPYMPRVWAENRLRAERYGGVAQLVRARES